MRIEYHRTLIADEVRNRAFKAALAASIIKGSSVVADIGAGTGLIGLMAARLGAREVYLYEVAEVAGVARQVLKKNRVRTCHIIPFHSTDAVDPPRVDIVVSETLGNYAFEENIVATMNDARQRHLKPGGTLIPSRIRQIVAPVIAARFHEELLAWDRVAGDLGLDIDLSYARTLSLNNIYVRRVAPDDLLDGGACAVCWDDADLTRACSSTRKGEAQFRIAKGTVVYGFAVWWEADLSPGITLSTAPGAAQTHWEQLYFPLLTPIMMRAGQIVGITLSSRSSEQAGTHLQWKAQHFDRDGKILARQALDLDKGYLP